jgi:hypothetical protein
MTSWKLVASTNTSARRPTSIQTVKVAHKHGRKHLIDVTIEQQLHICTVLNVFWKTSQPLEAVAIVVRPSSTPIAI